MSENTTGLTERPVTRPTAHYAFRHLNKRVTVLGYPPILGGFLVVAALMLTILSIAFKSKVLIVLACIYVPAFSLYTRKNMKGIKENKLDLMTLFFFSSKRTVYHDKESYLNKIFRNEKHR